MNLPYWLLRLLPLFDYLCPKCREEVSKNSHECPHCGEKYPFPLKVPPKVLKDPKALEAYVHKHVFPKVSASQRDYLMQFFTVYFSDGFESGDYVAWTIHDDAGPPTFQQVQAVTTHHGGYANRIYKSVGGGSGWANALKTISALTTLYVRLYARTSTLPSLNGDGWDFGGCTSVGSGAIPLNLTRIWNDNGIVKWRERYYNNGTEGDGDWTDPTPVINQWYCIETKMVIGNGTGEVTVWIDGVQCFLQGGLINSGIGDITDVVSGGGFTGVDGDEYFVDCFVAADAYIGPEAGAHLYFRSS